MIDWKSIESQYWGLDHFENIEVLQKKAYQDVQNGHPGFLLGGEFSFVVTQGLRGSEKEILNSGLQPIRTDRGGATTLHSPGQLVLYPVIDLRKSQFSVRDFISELLTVSQKSFSRLGVQAKVNLQPVGLWTSTGKIGFCGIRVKNGITQHGLALNVSNDLSLFSQIHSCGIQDGTFDRLSNFNEEQTPGNVFKTWVSTSQN